MAGETGRLIELCRERDEAREALAATEQALTDTERERDEALVELDRLRSLAGE